MPHDVTWVVDAHCNAEVISGQRKRPELLDFLVAGTLRCGPLSRTRGTHSGYVSGPDRCVRVLSDGRPALSDNALGAASVVGGDSLTHRGCRREPRQHTPPRSQSSDV